MGFSFKLLVTGPSGSGKSTLIARICQDFEVTVFDSRIMAIDYIKETGINDLGDSLRIIYNIRLERLQSVEEDIFEVSNDWPEDYFQKIVTNLFDSCEGRIMFNNAPCDICIQRQNGRKYPTPEYRVKHNCSLPYEYYKEKAEQLEVPIISYSGISELEKEYVEIKEFLIRI